MITLDNNKPLFRETSTIDAPLVFTELYAINPSNFPKWIPGIKKAKGSFGDLKVSELLNTKVSVIPEDGGILVDVIIGKDEHKILIKKSTLGNGLEITFNNIENFKIKTDFSLKALTDTSCSLNLETYLLEAKHKFHPILSFEIKMFLRLLLKNFTKCVEESYETIETNDKTIEAEILSFYKENVSQLQALIKPIKDDLGPDVVETLNKDIKTLAYNNSEKFNNVVQILLTSIPKDDLNSIITTIKTTLKNNMLTLKSLTKNTHSGALVNLNSSVKLHIDNCSYVVSTLLKDLPAETVVKFEKAATELLNNNLEELQKIIETIRDRVPAQDVKVLELGIINLMRKDITNYKSVLDKIVSGNSNLSDMENNIIVALKNNLDKYEETINNEANTAYLSSISMSEKAISDFKNSLTKISTNLTPEKIDEIKLTISAKTSNLYNDVNNILKEATPENLAANKDKFDSKVSELLERYEQAAKIIIPNIDSEKLNLLTQKIKETLEKEYDSFSNKK